MATNQEEGVAKETREALVVDASGDATAVWNTIKDLHMELIVMYHRVCLKLTDLGSGKVCCCCFWGADQVKFDSFVSLLCF